MFFKKPPASTEYQVLDDRLEAWQARVAAVVAVLSAMYDERRDETQFVGGEALEEEEL